MLKHNFIVFNFPILLFLSLLTINHITIWKTVIIPAFLWESNACFYFKYDVTL